MAVTSLEELQAWAKISLDLGLSRETINAAILSTVAGETEGLTTERSFDEKRFIDLATSLKPGVTYSAKAISNMANAGWHRQNKRAGSLLKFLGWQDTGIRQDGCTVYQKPHLHVGGSAD